MIDNLTAQTTQYETTIATLEKENQSMVNAETQLWYEAEIESMRLIGVGYYAKSSDLDEENKLLKKQLDTLLKTIESLKQN